MTVGGKMSNDKPREVKRAAAPEWCRLRRAQEAANLPVEGIMERPRHLSDRFRLRNGHRNTESEDVVLETFTLPLEAARLTARDIIGDISRRGYRRIVERWRQLPDGRIEFSMRRLPVAD
jgi:hypothetical protein